MDINLPRLRDRRIAASDESRSVANASIYVSTSRFSRVTRPLRIIRTIVLHQTDGNNFLPGGTGTLFPLESDEDSLLSSAHTLDRITAHFVILNNGIIFYVRDVGYTLQSISGRKGIDIEFAGRFHGPNQLSRIAIQSGRSLIKILKSKLPNITHLHPHGQLQRYNRTPNNTCSGSGCNKYNTCPGPDIWVNVGEYAVRHFGLTSHTTAGNYQNNGISPVQSDPSYDQGI